MRGDSGLRTVAEWRVLSDDDLLQVPSPLALVAWVASTATSDRLHAGEPGRAVRLVAVRSRNAFCRVRIYARSPAERAPSSPVGPRAPRSTATSHRVASTYPPGCWRTRGVDQDPRSRAPPNGTRRAAHRRERPPGEGADRQRGRPYSQRVDEFWPARSRLRGAADGRDDQPTRRRATTGLPPGRARRSDWHPDLGATRSSGSRWERERVRLFCTEAERARPARRETWTRADSGSGPEAGTGQRSRRPRRAREGQAARPAARPSSDRPRSSASGA